MGEAIGTNVDNALAAFGELGLSLGNEFVFLLANPLKQLACKLVCGALWTGLRSTAICSGVFQAFSLR